MESFLSNFKDQLTLFYKPWCPSCKHLMPILEQLAEENKDLEFSAVDCTKEEDFCRNMGVNAYPRLKYFYDNESFINYQGKQNPEQILEFMRQGYTELTDDSEKIADYLKNYSDEVVSKIDKKNMQNFKNRVLENEQERETLYINKDRKDQEFKLFLNKNSNKVQEIAFMISFILISVFLCILKDCAFRSARKNKND
ncbi:Thioredoxin-like fold [Pseudocohnilembus persalinus]|uniref:Thioredoxin-like fold n=1 Tax=Pseudocohnilembus persalinus TaxID=266149 RepID=A0A0V0R7C5_PSEPJ|nr:Thioredoxin-like fold [Pseudocohnilembus persalinus]|eukprot:KRX10406.1 Thioredoxin-like fold [Pseudocohnilembus persalinus]